LIITAHLQMQKKNIFSDFIDCVGYYTALGYNVIHGVPVFVFFTFA